MLLFLKYEKLFIIFEKKMEIIFASTKLIFASILFTHPLKNNNFINTSTYNFKHFTK